MTGTDPRDDRLAAADDGDFCVSDTYESMDDLLDDLDKAATKGET